MDKKILLLIFLLFSIFPVSAQSPEIEITGTITSEEEPVPFASVGLQGTSYGGITNEQGFFSLKKVLAGNYTLVVSVVGFQEYKKTVGVGPEKVSLKINLVKTQQRLREVVI